MPNALPDRPVLDGLEAKWSKVWADDGTYRFDRSKTRAEVYSIDTPPPTVSGSLHLGTVFGYVQTDALARYKRMSGYEVFYPMGWDDNGLPTERRVQNHYNVRCDPSLPYDPAELTAENPEPKRQRPVSRRAFVELCRELTQVDEVKFEDLWRFVGLSVDWQLTYATIDDHSRRVAQRAFLRNLARGEAYSKESPTLWDIDFQTAVAQAEMEDREVAGQYVKLAFRRADGSGAVEIETTRPELLPACVAVVVHPDDERFADVVGTTVVSPLFGVEVPVHAHPLADPAKGTGAAMVCTFGDQTDVTWWSALNLPVRTVIRRDGRFLADVPEWLTGDGAAVYTEVAGRTAAQARRRITELLGERGEILGEPRQVRHAVKFYEKGDRPLEVVSSRQWYIRNSADDPALQQRLLERGRELAWSPDFMKVRYEHWVQGLNSNWLISRQRYFGVPFPVWYPVADSGEPDWDSPIVPEESSLPVDPQADVAPGCSAEQRGMPGGFVGDADIMDTWATSSLTPQIVCGWAEDDDLFARTYPMDLRPQGPEIIRTWLFATLLRSHLEADVLPWRQTAINGWILDPDRKKMSKSKNNVITPNELLDQFGADAVRYWACSAAPGTDFAASTEQMKVGRRLATKLLNASKFVMLVGGEAAAAALDAALEHVTHAVDRAEIARLAAVVERVTTYYESYRYDRALELGEEFLWDFCDNYLELVKDRAYRDDDDARSARAALAVALDTLLRLLAPTLPYATEEVWSWFRDGSVHRRPWPDAAPLHKAAAGGQPLVIEAATAVLTHVRRAKSQAKVSLKTPLARLVVTDSAETIDALRFAEDDLRQACGAPSIELVVGDATLDVALSEQ